MIISLAHMMLGGIVRGMGTFSEKAAQGSTFGSHSGVTRLGVIPLSTVRENRHIITLSSNLNGRPKRQEGSMQVTVGSIAKDMTAKEACLSPKHRW